MQVSIESLEGLQRKMTVQIPAENITQAIDEKLKKISQTVRMDGFRPGKVPVSIVKQTYGPQVREEVIGELIQSSYQEAIIQEKQRPASPPSIEAISPEEGEKSVSYSATFEVYPEIESVKLEGISVDKPVVDISEADIDAMIDKLLQQRKSWSEVERAATAGDQVFCDYDGTIDGTPFQGGSGKDMTVEIGAGKMLKEFESGLEGMSKGDEKTVDVHFPDDYHGKEVAGKTAQFNLKVSKVSEPSIPELNEETIKSFGVESGDETSFRSDIKLNMTKELNQKLKTTVKNGVMSVLLENNEVAAPAALVKDEINNMKKQMAQSMGQDPDKADLSNFPDDLFEAEAARRVQLGLLIGELIKQQNLKLDKSRFDETLQELASSYEQPEQVVQYYTSNSSARASLEGMVLEDQVVDHILAKATVNEVATSFDEVMNSAEATQA